MAENRILATSVAQVEPLESGTTGVEPVVRSSGEPIPSLAQDRVVSESASLDLPRARENTTARKPSAGRQKSHSDGEDYRTFRQLCDAILAEVNALEPMLSGDHPPGEVPGEVVEIEVLLDRLYACRFGKDELLKRVVVAIQSQINNTAWDRRHVQYVKDVFRYLRLRYVLGEDTVQACYDMMKLHGLDRFRGTVSAPDVAKQYRIQEVTAD